MTTDYCNPSSQQPSRFDLDFVIDGVRHHYGFEASDTKFVSEGLYTFPRSHSRTLFERTGDEFRFGRELRGQNSSIARLTRTNSLYLSAAAQNGHEQLSRIFEYFRSIRSVRDINVPGTMASRQLAEDGPDGRVINFLGEVGTGVVGYRRNETEIPEETRTFLWKLTEVLRTAVDEPDNFELDEDGKHVTIELAHQDRGGKQVYLELDRESAGTRRLLILLDFAFRELDEGVLLLVDELDASLHTHACEAVLRLFCSPRSNPKGAQLLATTHNTNLMNSSALRRDQLWFTQKDAYGATKLYPLIDIRTRKSDNLEKGYLQGR